MGRFLSVCVCVFLLCTLMALKSYLETFESCCQWLKLQFSVCYLRSLSGSQTTVTASEAERVPLALQHVVVALVIIIISVVIEIRTVIGSRYQGEGPIMVLWVQWFLLNADVMPGTEDANSVLTCWYPFSIITFHTWKHKQTKKETNAPVRL